MQPTQDAQHAAASADAPAAGSPQNGNGTPAETTNGLPEALPTSDNLIFVEQLYADYLADPTGIEPTWREYFDSLARTGHGASAPLAQPSFRAHSLFNPPRRGSNGLVPTVDVGQDRVDQLVRAYRVRGHLNADLDPLGRARSHDFPALRPEYYGFSDSDYERVFSSRTIAGKSRRRLGEIVELLRDTYCRSIGVQFMHIDDLEIRHWLQERMEGSRNRLNLARRQQLRVLTRLTDATIFEDFIQKKFLGAKRFSLEGAESLIPLLDMAIERAGEQGIDEIVLAMAHRGRLNVLANILDKSPRQIFREFADLDADLQRGGGDVKYHLGFHSDWQTAGGREIHLALCFNPSHLEYVNPVAQGRMRAKQDRLGDNERRHGMVLLIHGDAAIAGEGIVQEALNLSELPGYRTGGTLHIVINNQIGFTTDPEHSRSTQYCTDICKMLQIPIFHVNGEDAEAVAQVVNLAMDFRHKWQRDAVIDMYCYRRYGHNEGDEPAFTQPDLYKLIRARKSVRQGYLDHLLEFGDISREDADAIADARREQLEEELKNAQKEGPTVSSRPSVLGRVWSRYRGGPDDSVPESDTSISKQEAVELLEKLSSVPESFTPHSKIKRFLQARAEMAAGSKPLDWATGEALAFASLLTNGTPIRISGQDSERGTFSQRHSVLHDIETGARHVSLANLKADQARFEVFNSPLAEASVLGFEYGYSVAYPDGLVLWEAQFGDFVNCAQVIIDQFLSSAEDKWFSLNGLVMLLPHGFEGQGPEHSSGRIERFLTLCAEDNMQIVYPTTPAQFFHVLRRQIVRPWRKPLVVFTPKSLLRDPRATSSLEALTSGTFQRIIPDDSIAPADVRKILLCSGKVYYDLMTEREERQRKDVAIIRVEQYYPLAESAISAVLAPFDPKLDVTWVQEEPANMGAWPYWRLRFGSEMCGRKLHGVSREASASPATGSHGSHAHEQRQLLDAAFAND